MRMIVPVAMSMRSVSVPGVRSVAVFTMRMMRVHAWEHRAAIAHYKGCCDHAGLIPTIDYPGRLRLTPMRNIHHDGDDLIGCRHAQRYAFGAHGQASSDNSAGIMRISIVIPVCNEEENVGPLAREIHHALTDFRPFEIIFVDDGSTDGTVAALLATQAQGIPELRLLRHSKRSGQSAAVCSGIRAASAEWIATLDGDGQNDPADIPALIAVQKAREDRVGLVMGNRKASRQDTLLRKVSSSVANGVRSWFLKDSTPDSGCGIKLMHRETFLALPRFDHMHRFLPALFLNSGSEVISVPVRHRARTHGTSKYGLRNRLWVGIVDLFGVRWILKRNPPRPKVVEQGIERQVCE
jgi:dolichol-phosphate mannosyltransferase